MARPTQLRKLVHSASLAGGGGVVQVDFDVLGYDYCTYIARLNGTTTISDLTISNCKLFALDENAPLVDIGIIFWENADAVQAVGGNIQLMRRVRVSGFSKIRATFTNVNASAKVLEVWQFVA